jgi:flagellar protein FliT
MMNSQEIISIYENVAVLTGQMLAAARSSEWDQLVELESRCARDVAILTSEEARTALPGNARTQKVEIIKKILEHDREIRDITTPWMARLSTMINSTGTERKLARTYGAQHAG